MRRLLAVIGALTLASCTPAQLAAIHARQQPPPDHHRTSTAYCLRGTMANGERVHDGAVASRDLALGSRWQVLDGPLAGRVFTVKDRGPGASFDVWMASCADASRYGRRSVTLARV